LPPSGKFGGKIQILSTHIAFVGNLLAVCWNVATSCPLTFSTHDAAVSRHRVGVGDF